MLEQSHQQRAGDALSSGEESEQKIPSGSCSYDTMESHRVPSARTYRNNGVFNRHCANYPLTSIPVSPLTSFGACICTWLQRKVATVGPEHRLSVPAGFVSLRFVSYQGTKGAKAWAELSPEARRPFFCLLAPIRNSTQAIPPNSYSLAVAQSVYSCRQVLFSVETWPLVGRILSVSLHMHGTGIST
jgi:hypothetical protein